MEGADASIFIMQFFKFLLCTIGLKSIGTGDHSGLMFLPQTSGRLMATYMPESLSPVDLWEVDFVELYLNMWGSFWL